jgi:hypothetical protein
MIGSTSNNKKPRFANLALSSRDYVAKMNAQGRSKIRGGNRKKKQKVHSLLSGARGQAVDGDDSPLNSGDDERMNEPLRLDRQSTPVQEILSPRTIRDLRKQKVSISSPGDNDSSVGSPWTGGQVQEQSILPTPRVRDLRKEHLATAPSPRTWVHNIETNEGFGFDGVDMQEV